jgi:hypothetical protein
MAARQNRVSVPTGTDEQRRCARDWHCSSKTRDPETGEWNAAAGSPLCPADADVLVTYLGELPGCYERLAERSLDPLRTGRAVRRPPGSRVLVGPEFDALMRVTADTIGGWAARVRAVPGLRLSRHGFEHGSPGQVREDCQTLARHPAPLLALPEAPMQRTWTWPPGSPMPAWLEEEIGHLDAVAGDGDGWVRAFTRLDGEAAALDVFDLRRDAVRLLTETPAPRELLDGVPCRKCEAMSSLEVLPLGEPHPETGKPPPFCRCSVRSCGDEMTRAEYGEWTGRYDSYVRGAGVKVCRRCERQDCHECRWPACACARGPHPRRRATTA